MANEKNFIDSEYNAFGPWIFKVTQENPMPPLFLPYYKENQNCLMIIKIPRNIDRRDAKPGMNLYDYVIGMYETYGYILKRKDKEVEEIRFYYDQVENIENYKDLLIGRLTIELINNSIVIPYNTISKEIIYQFVKIIRDRYAKKKYKNISIINRIEKKEITDTLYGNFINEMNLQGDILNIMAFQPEINIYKNNRILGQKLLELIMPKLLLSTIHLINDKELLVINSGQPINYLRQAIYSYSFIYIPIEKINNIKFDRCPKYKNLKIVYISTKENAFEFYFDENNENLIDFYKKLNGMI